MRPNVEGLMDTFWISGSAFSTALRRPYVTTAGEGLFPSMYSWYRLSKVLKYSPRVTENANNSCVPYTRASCGTSVPHRQWPQQLFSGSAAGFPEDCLQSWSFQEHVIKGSSMDFGRRVEHYPRAVGFFFSVIHTKQRQMPDLSYKTGSVCCLSSI